MRLLDALVHEVIQASDKELTEVATDLRMDLNTKESGAFAGLTYFARPQLSDFIDIEVPKRLGSPAERLASDRRGPKDRQRRSKRPQIPTERKPPSGK